MTDLSVCWLLIGDGRDEYHERSLASAREMLPTPDAIVQIDDRDHSLGFAGAVAEGWRQVSEKACDYVVHIEADFTFPERVPVHRMIRLLERNPHIAQMVLKRQPVNQQEIAAGGIVEKHPDDFRQTIDRGDVFTTHRRYWSTNPGVYSTAFCDQGWPQVPESEGSFTHRLLDNPDLAFGMWGAKFDPPRCIHIGDTRAGTGY
jgi:hypothetical protein